MWTCMVTLCEDILKLTPEISNLKLHVHVYYVCMCICLHLLEII